MIDVEAILTENPVPNKGQTYAASKLGSVQLKRIAEHLVNCCQQKKTITYLEVAEAVDIQAPHRIHRVTKLLEALMELDQKHDQPLRAALVVSRSVPNLPGEGFFLKAQELGLMNGVSASEFHQQCLNRLFDGQAI